MAESAAGLTGVLDTLTQVFLLSSIGGGTLLTLAAADDPSFLGEMALSCVLSYIFPLSYSFPPPGRAGVCQLISGSACVHNTISSMHN